MTEKSIMKGFKAVFGVHSNIFAKILYINLSKMCDYARLSFKDFIEALEPLKDLSITGRYRFPFDFLDLDKDGYIDILSLILIYKRLPERCLLKFELLLLLEEYKNKNIMKSHIGFSIKPIKFGVYKMLIPQSCLLKSL